MIDTEVMRLRRLRDVALRVRALAAAMDSSPARSHTVFCRTAVSCWRIARIVTGRLRAHPYPSYQRDSSGVRAVYNAVNAQLTVGLSRRRGNGLQMFSGELRRVARELDDARALTWSADLSDALGRLQMQVRRLVTEVEIGARRAAGSLIEAPDGIEAELSDGPNESGSMAANWPYLAF